MTVLERIRLIVQTAGYDKNQNTEVMFSQMVEAVMPKITENINAQCKENGYEVTYNRPASEYPEAFYRMLWVSVIRETALDYLEASELPLP